MKSFDDMIKFLTKNAKKAMLLLQWGLAISSKSEKICLKIKK